MKKYRIIDVDTEENYEVEEMTDEPIKPIDPPDADVKDEDGGLTAEEVDALKKLAAVADKLIGMIKTEDSDIEPDENLEDECSEDLKDEGEEVEKEEIVETDCDTRDSKASFGSIERRKQSTSDSAIVDDISAAWAKRYGGK